MRLKENLTRRWYLWTLVPIILLLLYASQSREDPCDPRNHGTFDGKVLYQCAVKAVANTHINLTSPEKRQEFLSEWLKKYDGTDRLSTERGTLKAVSEMMLSLRARFDYFLNPDDAKKNNIIASGRIAGIGASVSTRERTFKKPSIALPDHLSPQLLALLKEQLPEASVVSESNPAVVEANPRPGTPAFEGGLRKGDIILAVNGESTAGKTIEGLTERIRGSVGSPVTITVSRGGETLNLKMVRNLIRLPTTEHKRIDNTGYLRIYHFESLSVIDDVHEALDEICNPTDETPCAATSLVVDLRDNPGGLMNAVIVISELLLPNGEIVATIDREGDRTTRRTYSTGGGKLTIKTGALTAEMDRDFEAAFPGDRRIVVLVNERSGSGAEMLAAVLQKQRSAIVIGKQTVGKGVGQCQVDLPYGYSSRIVCMEYLSGGISVDWSGVTPDLTIDQSNQEEFGGPADLQMQRALQISRGESFSPSSSAPVESVDERKARYNKEVEDILNRFIR